MPKFIAARKRTLVVVDYIVVESTSDWNARHVAEGELLGRTYGDESSFTLDVIAIDRASPEWVEKIEKLIIV